MSLQGSAQRLLHCASKARAQSQGLLDGPHLPTSSNSPWKRDGFAGAALKITSWNYTRMEKRWTQHISCLGRSSAWASTARSLERADRASGLSARMPRASTAMGSSVTGAADVLSLQGLEKKGKHAEVPV